jgi:hypothetical protein
MRLQFGRGQATRCDELLQISRQLHGHRTYFFPGGAFRMGYNKATVVWIDEKRIKFPYRRLVTLITLYNMLFPLPGDVNHC